MASKILTKNSLARVVRRLRSQGKRIAFTNGTFDILHLGHVTYLQKARQKESFLSFGMKNLIDKIINKYFLNAKKYIIKTLSIEIINN